MNQNEPNKQSKNHIWASETLNLIPPDFKTWFEIWDSLNYFQNPYVLFSFKLLILSREMKKSQYLSKQNLIP